MDTIGITDITGTTATGVTTRLVDRVSAGTPPTP
jgi:hypothetical protein